MCAVAKKGGGTIGKLRPHMVVVWCGVGWWCVGGVVVCVGGGGGKHSPVVVIVRTLLTAHTLLAQGNAVNCVNNVLRSPFLHKLASVLALVCLCWYDGGVVLPLTKQTKPVPVHLKSNTHYMDVRGV